MWNIDCTKSQVIVMCGISGSGKTHYAHQLELYSYIRLSTDAWIWDKAGDQLYSLSEEEQKRLFEESGKQMRIQLEDMLKSGRKVVVDATNCKRCARDDIRNICSKYKVKPLFAFCDADLEELRHRLSKRNGSGPDDLIVSTEELSEYWNGFERPQEDESDFIFLNDGSIF